MVRAMLAFAMGLCLISSSFASRVQKVQAGELDVDSMQKGKCPNFCSVVAKSGPNGAWYEDAATGRWNMKTPDELRKIIDARCSVPGWEKCSRCDGTTKRGNRSPCCQGDQCGAKEPPAPENQYVNEEERAADIQAVVDAVTDAGVGDGVDVDGLEDLLGDVVDTSVLPPKYVAPDGKKKQYDSKPCPGQVTWNMGGWPRCRNYVPGDSEKGQFVQNTCCAAQIKAEVEYNAAMMCLELENTACKKAEGKARKKAGKGLDKIQEAVAKVLQEEKVDGTFPLGFKCEKMYMCQTTDDENKKVLIGPLESCHVNGTAIGTRLNTCVAVPA